MSESNLLHTCGQQQPGTSEHHNCSRWSAASSGDLRQVPSDLSHFRRRIDDSIREQRRTREIVEEAQDKLRNLRQHQAQVEASLASSPSTPRFSSSDYRSSRHRRLHHRSMSSLEEELSSKMFTTGGGEDQRRPFDSDTRPSSSGGRLKSSTHEKTVSFTHPPDFDVTIAWPFHPPSSSTPLRGGHNTLASQSELYASHSYRLMLLEDMLASCKLQLETSLRANATANSEIHVTRDKLQKLMDENKTSLDRAAHFEAKYKHLLHLVQPRLYDLRNQTRSLQQRLIDVNMDVGKEVENYRENFSLNIKTLQSIIPTCTFWKVEDLNAKSALQERQIREAESEIHQYKRQVLHLNNKIEQLSDTIQSKETTISILEQDFQEEKDKVQKFEEQNDELFRQKTTLQEETQESSTKIRSLRQKLDDAREDRDKFEAESRRLTSELSQLRSASEARVDQLSTELNDAALALEAEREGWFKRQDSLRQDFKQQNDTLQERMETLQSELEHERTHVFDYKTRIEELQLQAQQSENHISELKRRIYTENSTRIQDLERQLTSAQQVALQSTGDWKKYEQRVSELEVELHEYKLQFERERRDKSQAQHDYDAAKSELERSEQILKETNSEKQQLLRSVNIFEQENRDLKKVCKQLRTEIDGYQKDSNTKYARVLEAKRSKEQEEIRRLKSEIAHMDKTHAQREQNLLQRLNETNTNFGLLREQFDRRMQQERDQSTTTFVANPTLPSTSTTHAHPPGSIHTSTVVRRVTYSSNSSSKLGRPV
ncbi:hypothetical protein M3Y97_00475200 [Aphelenchoides bicaudatus]|nr:hypothetical protein M3Y97_00475200 [Aphelenchoides bicaudatus]